MGIIYCPDCKLPLHLCGSHIADKCAGIPMRASHEQLTKEAEDWDSGKLTPKGWVDAPEAVPIAKSKWQPKSADQYTSAQKCAAFDKLHAKAMEHWNTVVENGSADSDDAHYIFEDVMTLCLGKNVFTHYNKLLD